MVEDEQERNITELVEIDGPVGELNVQIAAIVEVGRRMDARMKKARE